MWSKLIFRNSVAAIEAGAPHQRHWWPFKQAPRSFGRRWAWTGLFLPTILSAFYFLGVAADQYESEARFVVRSAARPEVPGGLAFLVQLGLARPQDDSFIVQDYLTSRDAIACF